MQSEGVKETAAKRRSERLELLRTALAAIGSGLALRRVREVLKCASSKVH